MWQGFHTVDGVARNGLTTVVIKYILLDEKNTGIKEVIPINLLAVAMSLILREHVPNRYFLGLCRPNHLLG